MKNLEQHEPEPELLRLGDYRRHFVWSGSGLGGWLHRITSQCSPTRCLHRAGIKLSNHIFSEEVVDHELCFCDMSACSVAVSYKPPMLVTRFDSRHAHFLESVVVCVMQMFAMSCCLGLDIACADGPQLNMLQGNSSHQHLLPQYGRS